MMIRESSVIAPTLPKNMMFAIACGEYTGVLKWAVEPENWVFCSVAATVASMLQGTISLTLCFVQSIGICYAQYNTLM